MFRKIKYLFYDIQIFMNISEIAEPYRQYVIDMTPEFLLPSAHQFFQRVYSWEMWFVYIMIIIVNILFLFSSIFGILSKWYKRLPGVKFNPIAFSIIWVIFSVLSYTSIFMIWKHGGPYELPNDLGYGILFLIGSLLSLAWSVSFFQGQNITAGLWLSIITFLYYYGLMIHIGSINLEAVAFIIPLVLIYGYIVYNMANLNNLVIK